MGIKEAICEGPIGRCLKPYETGEINEGDVISLLPPDCREPFARLQSFMSQKFPYSRGFGHKRGQDWYKARTTIGGYPLTVKMRRYQTLSDAHLQAALVVELNYQPQGYKFIVDQFCRVMEACDATNIGIIIYTDFGSNYDVRGHTQGHNPIPRTPADALSWYAGWAQG